MSRRRVDQIFQFLLLQREQFQKTAALIINIQN